MEHFYYLQNLLPPSYQNIVVEFSKLSDYKFNAIIRINLFSEENAKSWLDQFEKITNLNYRVLRTYPQAQNNGSPMKVVFKKDYRCHHNTRANLPSSKTKQPSAKHVGCPAFLRITIKNSKMKRSKDQLLATHPCEITIKHIHNHLTECADVLRHRRPSQETENKILDLFAKGHSPSSALEMLKNDLQELHGDDYYRISADGALCPNLQWVYHRYYSKFKKVYSAPDGNKNEITNVQQDLQRLFEKLKQHVEEDPEMLAPCQTFIRMFDNTTTKSSLASSLKTFGKNQLCRSRKRKRITVQPTSIAGKKVYLRGRRKQHTGRPKKHLTPEHSYAKKYIINPIG